MESTSRRVQTFGMRLLTISSNASVFPVSLAMVRLGLNSWYFIANISLMDSLGPYNLTHHFTFFGSCCKDVCKIKTFYDYVGKSFSFQRVFRKLLQSLA